MFGEQILKQGVELTAADKKLLQDTTIGLDGPGTILADFEAVLNYVVEKRPFLTKSHLLSLKELEPLNQLLRQPVRHGLTRPMQKSLPPLNGLFLLLRASGITAVATTRKKARLVANEPVLASWHALNPTEKYFMLLESWLLRGSGEIVGERYSSNMSMMQWVHFFAGVPAGGVRAANDSDIIDRFRYWPGLHNLALMDLFGFAQIEQGRPVAREGWPIKTVKTTPLGWAMLRAALVMKETDIALLLGHEELTALVPGKLQPYFQPYFPEWQNNLQWPQPEFQDGVYIFKVELFSNAWWRIAAPATADLEQLSLAILSAAKFDNDHLHRFVYNTPQGFMVEALHPYMEERPHTDEVRVGDLPLSTGDTMLYNFDFGDDWQFDLTLEEIKPPDKKMRQPQILESHGEAPPQYPDYDEDW